MEVISLNHPYSVEQVIDEPIALALGYFDGVHLGHQSVLKHAKEEALHRDIPMAVMTFNQHPKIIYKGIHPDEMKYLSTLNRKLELFDSLGVDIVYVVNYTFEFGAQTPQEFVDNYIVGLNAKVVIAGFDYTYGLKKIANMNTLPDHAKGRFDVVEVSKLEMHKHKIGSTSIKEFLRQGRIEEANRELGYAYETSGVVIHGDKRGRLLGYPTANVQTSRYELLPGIGIYAVEFYVHDQWYRGMASIGYNATFEDVHELRCEVNIFDFDQDIYGEAVKIRWHQYLRGEEKFNSIDDLIEQLRKDEINAKEILSSQL